MKLITSFKKFTFLDVPREQNERADTYQSWLAPREAGIIDHGRTKGVLYGDEKDVDGPVFGILQKGRRSRRAALARKRGFSFPLLKCLDTDEVEYVMRKANTPICGSHIGGGALALASKVASVGYYWPTLKHDCLEYIKKCNTCQRFVDVHKAPLEQLHSIMSHSHSINGASISLAPSQAAKQIRYLIVVVDYFIKWVKAKPVATISTEGVKDFYWKRLICHFGLPVSVAKFCLQLKIQQSFTSIEHPQTNGQAKAANKVILRGLRRWLKEAKERWVLWSYHTTPDFTTNETPFFLTFGTEAMIPVEIEEPSPGPPGSSTLKMKTSYKTADIDKLTSNWEGPYRIAEDVGKGAYRLEHLDGRKIPRT
ncbi:hypothetical protein CR513_30504, partial [Mucuna pruriens]